MILSTLSTRLLELVNSTERLEGRSPIQRVATYKKKSVWYSCCLLIHVCLCLLGRSIKK